MISVPLAVPAPVASAHLPPLVSVPLLSVQVWLDAPLHAWMTTFGLPLPGVSVSRHLPARPVTVPVRAPLTPQLASSRSRPLELVVSIDQFGYEPLTVSIEYVSLVRRPGQ